MNGVHPHTIVAILSLASFASIGLLLVFHTVPPENQQLMTFILGAISGVGGSSAVQRLAPVVKSGSPDAP